MSKPSWQASLSQRIKGNEAHGSVPRIAMVGMGHELRGDDAAGLAVARALRTALEGNEHWLVIDAGAAPENQTGPLRRFKPDVVLLVDAAQMDEAPGTVCWLSWNETGGISASTHSLSPRVLARFLMGELGCEVDLLGIQPANNAIDTRLSPEVAEAVAAIVDNVVIVVEAKGDDVTRIEGRTMAI
jgi:hydrogenase 3 maturation protease